MKVYGTGSNADSQTETVNSNNLGAATTALEMGDASLAAFYVVGNNGAWTTNEIILQVSPDGTNWFDTTHSVTGVGNLHDIGCAAHSIRCKVSVAQGALSTVDVTVLVK